MRCSGEHPVLRIVRPIAPFFTFRGFARSFAGIFYFYKYWDRHIRHFALAHNPTRVKEFLLFSFNKAGSNTRLFFHFSSSIGGGSPYFFFKFALVLSFVSLSLVIFLRQFGCNLFLLTR